MPILQIQRRMMELGRVRLGEKGPKGEPKRRDTFRFTTASEDLAKAIAAGYGGTPEPWNDAPSGDGYWQVATDATEIDIVLPPMYSAADGEPTTTWSQWFELWGAAGCQRRCDGETETLTGKPCMCAAAVTEAGEDARECQVTTRVSFLMPDIPGVGVWLLTSHGWNAAAELPGTLEILVRAAAEHAFIPAVLRIEHRTKRVPGEGHPRRFVVPVIDLPQVTIKQLASGEAPLVLNAPRQAPPKPALPAGPEPPEPTFTDPADLADFGTPPPLPIDTTELADTFLEITVALGGDPVKMRELADQHSGDEEWFAEQIEKGRRTQAKAAQLETEAAGAESLFEQKAAEAQAKGRRARA